MFAVARLFAAMGFEGLYCWMYLKAFCASYGLLSNISKKPSFMLTSTSRIIEYSFCGPGVVCPRTFSRVRPS